MLDRRSLLLSVALATAAAVPQGAQAQVTGDVPVQQFQPMQVVSGPFNHVYGANTLGHLQPAFGLWLNYAARPLEVQSYAPAHEQVDLIRSHLQADLAAALGIGERLQLGLALPVTPYISQGEDGFLVPPDIAGAGLGDVRLSALYRILGDGSGFDLAAAGIVSLPTGDQTRYLGNAGVTVEPKLIAGLNLANKLDLGANLGFVVRPQTQELFVNNNALITVGHELSYGFGARYGLESAGIDVMAELYGRVAFSEALDGSSVPLELDVSARRYMGAAKNHAVTVGGGTGLIGGYGSPVARVFVGYAFAPQPRSDADGDGIFDNDDDCPNEPEDLDNFKDDDGCPDPDNDGDGLLDGVDKCPNKPEDMDAFEDEDGCPDPDNDGDGVLDADDRCPQGLTDPAGMEDMDGFKDDDGCLDRDNDSDGVLDVDDRCPNEKETINGVDDLDGCPDVGKSDVERTDTHLIILQEVFFETASDVIQGKSFKVLDQVALTLNANLDINLVEVEGHTDDVGDDAYNLDLSHRRAQSVKRYLEGKGVEASRLRAQGYGETRPLAKGTSAKARAKNRRVAFRIVEVGGAAYDQVAPGGMGTSAPGGAEAGADVAAPTSAFSGTTGQFKVLMFFPESPAQLDARGEQLCQTFATWMGERPKMRVRLTGFSDDTGASKADIAVSRERAEAVKTCLVARGIDAGRIEVKALGSTWPREANDTPEHRAENRRVRLLPLTASGNEIKALPTELDVALPTF